MESQFQHDDANRDDYYLTIQSLDIKVLSYMCVTLVLYSTTNDNSIRVAATDGFQAFFWFAQFVLPISQYCLLFRQFMLLLVFSLFSAVNQSEKVENIKGQFY